MLRPSATTPTEVSRVPADRDSLEMGSPARVIKIAVNAVR